MSRRAALVEPTGAAFCAVVTDDDRRRAPLPCAWLGGGSPSRSPVPGRGRSELLGVGSVPHGLLIALAFAVGWWLRRGQP